MNILRFVIAAALVCGLGYAMTQGNTIGVAGTQFTHSGGTDKCGCHHNRKTGEYHCHTRKKRGGDCPPQSDIKHTTDPRDHADTDHTTKSKGKREA